MEGVIEMIIENNLKENLNNQPIVSPISGIDNISSFMANKKKQFGFNGISLMKNLFLYC